MEKQSIWISYDLGIKGDYQGLYRWLDIHKAKECGNSVAYFKYEYSSDLIAELTNDLKNNIEFTNGDRIYVVFLVENDDGHKSTAGQFIVGHRKSSPWEGYGPSGENILDQ